jgi:dipeptidyl aminopeptidase/acylaminoacyl peptidase
MVHRRAALAGACLLAVGAFAGAAGAQTARPLPPVEAFGNLPFFTKPKLSPDGKHIAAIQYFDGKPAATIYEVNAPAGARPLVYQDPKWIVDGVSWVKNDRVIIYMKDHRWDRTWSGALSFSTGGEDPVALPSSHIVDKDLDDPTMVYEAIGVGVLALLRVDVTNAKGHEVNAGMPFEGQWLMDGHGGIVGRVDRLHAPLTDRLRLYNDGSWRDVMDFDAKGDAGADVHGLSLDGKSLVLTGKGDRESLVLLDRDTGKLGATVFSNDKYDAAYSIHDDWTNRVIGAAYMADSWKYTYFDPSRAAVQGGIEQAFPGTDAYAYSTDLAGDKMIVEAQSAHQPPTYYFLDRTTHQATKIASEYPDLAAQDLGDMKPYPYMARDGLAIDAYLTIPPGREAKNLPLVVMPHGGPDARDVIGFDWWAQFLANRGYAVFQPNYRGSTGYGRAFTDAGLHQWGLKMQDDITDGVKKLIADGVADPKRICIVGASYGGYAALAGATFTPDLYACAVSFAGISNLRDILEWEGARFGDINTSHASFWISRIGDISEDATRLDATSPALHADQVKIPILLMHGENDTTVPIYQSEEEERALLKAGKKVEFVRVSGDDHYFTLSATRIDMLTRVEKFLHDNIGN